MNSRAFWSACAAIAVAGIMFAVGYEVRGGVDSTKRFLEPVQTLTPATAPTAATAIPSSQPNQPAKRPAPHFNSIPVQRQSQPIPAATASGSPTDANLASASGPLAAPLPSHTKIRSYQLDVGRRMVINNSVFTDFEVHASGPIDIAIGDCAKTLTLSIECHGEAADIVIRDERPPLAVGKNLIVITMDHP